MMSQDRLDALSALVEAQPGEPMIWYGLANEYIKLTRWREAVEALTRVVTLNPDYTSAYQLLGTALMNLGRADEARQAWTEGIEVANRTGAWKARQHMESLLRAGAATAADAGDGGGLCSPVD